MSCQWLIMLQRLQVNIVFVSFQRSYETAEEIPKAVWCPSEVGPEIPGLNSFISISGLEEERNQNKFTFKKLEFREF